MRNSEEINKLIKLLGKTDIPFAVRTITVLLQSSIQVCFPDVEHCVVDAVSHNLSYGGPEGLIEVYATDDYSRITDNDAIGWLTAEQAFGYFEKANRLKKILEDEKAKNTI